MCHFLFVEKQITLEATIDIRSLLIIKRVGCHFLRGAGRSFQQPLASGIIAKLLIHHILVHPNGLFADRGLHRSLQAWLPFVQSLLSFKWVNCCLITQILLLPAKSHPIVSLLDSLGVLVTDVSNFASFFDCHAFQNELDKVLFPRNIYPLVLFTLSLLGLFTHFFGL